jgi:hypothetical protein
MNTTPTRGVSRTKKAVIVDVVIVNSVMLAEMVGNGVKEA